MVGVVGVIGEDGKLDGKVGDDAADGLWILGEAAKSLGEDGKLAHWVRDKDEVAEYSDVESEKDDWLECLEIEREKVDDVPLKSDCAGEVVTELDGEEVRLGDDRKERAGTWTSFRTTIRDR